MNMVPKGNTRYFAAVKYLESLDNVAGSYQKTNIRAHPHPEVFLERMQDFLDRIGNPEKRFKYVHITGTAGKGTVSSWVHAELVRSGKKAGLFTSPFVTSTIEKIKVGEKLIDPETFAEIVEELKPSIDGALMSGRHGMPSYFELIFAIALVYFGREKCEYAVLEVGLGGRYDATNIIAHPQVTAITNIDLDHTAVLGPRLEDIARDKAGIIKGPGAFFTTEERPTLRAIFKDTCRSVGSAYNAIPVCGLSYVERNRALAGSICISLGVIRRTDELGPIPELPGRFEMVSKKPIVVIDGAHNPSKIESTLFNLTRVKHKKLIVVIAISLDKKWERMLELLLPQADVAYFTRFTVPGRRCVSPQDLEEHARRLKFKGSVKAFTDPYQAFSEARKKVRSDDLVLVTGSFYLAGDIRALYCPEDQILENRSTTATTVTRISA